MEKAPIITTPTKRRLSVTIHGESIGISMRYIKEFISCFPKDQLEGKSTSKVCYEIIEPMTRELSCSHVDYYRSMREGQESALDGSLYGRANVFVSHAWASPFLDLVDALEVWQQRRRGSDRVGKEQGKVVEMDVAEEQEEWYFWIDLFIVNQHDTEERPFDWWETLFRSSMCDIGRALVVLNPWNAPVYATRAWCLYELSIVIQSDIPCEIILSSSQWSLLLDYLAHCDDSAVVGGGMAIQAITHIDIGKATASKEQDLKNIMTIVKKSVGISRLNQEVIRALLKWMVGVGLTQHDNLSDEEQARSKSYLGLLILEGQSGIGEFSTLSFR